VSVNTPALAVLALGALGPTETLVDAVFSRVHFTQLKEVEAWASEIGGSLRYCVAQYPGRFSDQTLRAIKDHCLTLHPADKDVPLPLLQSLTDIEGIVEHVEFGRFEQALRQSTSKQSEEVSDLESLLTKLGMSQNISSALVKAESYLHGTGEFDSKTAADLLRSSIDETHRNLVDRLEEIHGKSCADVARDGSRRAYMREIGFISIPEEKFFTSIYTLLSKEASHRLVAPRETVMVMFQTVHDYLILLLRRLALHRK